MLRPLKVFYNLSSCPNQVGKSRQELRREQQERLHGAQQLQKAEISRAFQFLNVSNDNSNASADGEEDHTVDEYNATDDEDNLNQSDEELQISGSTVERSRVHLCLTICFVFL